MEDRDDRLKSLGEFIRAQRQMADLSLRQLAEIAQISNPYLSQLEHGLHEPSARILQSIARALDVSADTLLSRAGSDASDASNHDDPVDGEAAIRNDSRLTDDQKRALLAVYRSYVQSNKPPTS
jgi:transcriptional regulator with XRE-family HTH domain